MTTPAVVAAIVPRAEARARDLATVGQIASAADSATLPARSGAVVPARGSSTVELMARSMRALARAHGAEASVRGRVERSLAALAAP
jgi:hypothetical protein